jgi:predicted nucleic acid-binding Zn ribbon protein
MNRRAPRPLHLALASLGERLEPASTLAAAQRHWEAIAGSAVAAHSRPVAERSGVLDVSCDEAVWAAEIELLGPDLVAALNEALGRDALRSLRTRTGSTAEAL